jgi:hypothetical protein
MATNSQSDGSGPWTVHAYPISDAAAPTLPVVNMTAMAMHYSSGVAKPVMIVLRNPAANKGVHAARFNTATGKWEQQKQIIALAGTTTPGGAYLSADFDTSGNIIVAVHDLGTGAGASCSPTTTRCVRSTYSTNGGTTWDTAAQIYSGNAEGLNIKLNSANSRPGISFFTRASDVVQYRYCTTALATCNSASNWSSVGSGYIDLLAGVSGLVDNGAAANAGLLSTGLVFNSDGEPLVVWPRGSTATSNAHLMHSRYTGTSFSAPAVLRRNGAGNINTPVAANAGNFSLSWNPVSVKTSTGAIHTVYNGPGNFLEITSCGN